MTTATLIAPLLQYFFTEHLCAHKQVSPRTIISYRDSFRLLLRFLQTRTGREPSALTVSDLDAPAILAFLESLEAERSNAVCSRNARLSAVRSFFRVVALRDPASVGIVTRVMAIPVKRTEKRLVGYLTRPEIDALVAAPDQSGWFGRRDHALLLTMYNSGARASEVTSLRRGQVVHFDATTYLQLHGKGRKERTVPLWAKTARVLQQWFREREVGPDRVVFPTLRGTPLSSDGLDHLLQQAVRRAGQVCPSLLNKRITPHLVRHTTAMHLLQAGVDITVIALWLGHESIETTHIYLEADLALKERALEKVAPVPGSVKRFKADDALLAFLARL